MAGDDTADAKFVLFGRLAQRLIGRSVEILLEGNAAGKEAIPKEITNLLEENFTWKVAITENTMSSGNVSFQVNMIVGNGNSQNPAIPQSPSASQASSMVPSLALSPSVTHELSVGQSTAAVAPSIGFSDPPATPSAGLNSPLVVGAKDKNDDVECQSKTPVQVLDEEDEVSLLSKHTQPFIPESFCAKTFLANDLADPIG